MTRQHHLRLHSASLLALYRRLLSCYGEQNWWPADSPFEVMIGAILTQNVSWNNVTRAIDNLRQANCLSARALARLPARRLARLIRPCGFFNVKARRLQEFLGAFQRIGGQAALRRMDTGSLRRFLLGIHGIGPETADDILLYAFERPVFVIDAYTRRLFSRLAWIEGREPYEVLREAAQRALRRHTAIYGEYHALIVRHAKEPCSGRRDCRHCRVETMAGGAGRRGSGRGAPRRKSPAGYLSSFSKSETYLLT